ncbi:hypothetical protein ACFRLW_09330 [Streptomyces sp. NPDC056728]
MAAARGPEDLHRRAETGDEWAQLRLGDWYARKGYRREALKWFEPLADAGNEHALMMVTAVLLSLARTDSRYQPSAEAVLRKRGQLIRLSEEMRGWPGREADARELLVRLAVEQRSTTAVELAPLLPHDGADELRERAVRAIHVAQRNEQLENAKRALSAAYTDFTSSAYDYNPEAYSTYSNDSSAYDAAMIVGAAAAVPFAQAFATKAGSDFYGWVRGLFSRASGREGEELTERTVSEAALYVVGDPQTNTWLEMRGRPTDEALSKLAEADLNTLAAPDMQGRTVTVCWVPGASQWQRRVQETGDR